MGCIFRSSNDTYSG